MLKVALTGGIASGKTTTANLFNELGIDIIDADIIARELTAPGTELEATIIAEFGASTVATDGLLDRKKCRQLVFIDKQKKQWLEQLLHPQIRLKMRENLEKIRSAYAILVIPLLVESDHFKYIDRVCVIDIEQDLQLQRAMSRDHANAAAIKSVIKAQARQAARLAIADDVITNNGSIPHLKARVKQLNQLYLELSTTY